MVHGDEYENTGPSYQATYDAALWKEIKANADVCVGGTISEYSDQWWKGGDSWLHETYGYEDASHPDGYANDEWWGLVRVKKDGYNPDDVEPRAAYYKLQSLWRGIPQYSLTVTKTGSGKGIVTSSPTGILCGANCREPFNSGTTATLTAMPSKGFMFGGWTGACTGTGPLQCSHGHGHG